MLRLEHLIESEKSILSFGLLTPFLIPKYTAGRLGLVGTEEGMYVLLEKYTKGYSNECELTFNLAELAELWYIIQTLNSRLTIANHEVKSYVNKEEYYDLSSYYSNRLYVKELENRDEHLLSPLIIIGYENHKQIVLHRDVGYLPEIEELLKTFIINELNL